MANKETSIKTSGQRRIVFKSLIYTGLENKIKPFMAQNQKTTKTCDSDYLLMGRKIPMTTKYWVRPEEYSGVGEVMGGNMVMS